MNTVPKGTLFLIPTTLGDNEPLEVLPLSIKRTIEGIDHFIVENEKSARHFIKKISSNKSQPGLHIQILNKFTEKEALPIFLEPCLAGQHVGVISEAGCPGIADPGADVVALAHEKGIRVVPLVGPSSIVLALMASGLNGQNFAFNGYLPIDASERKSVLKKLEKWSKETGQTQIFIETPYRNDKLYTELLKVLAPSTLLCIGCELTLSGEFIATKKIMDWRNITLDLHKKPTIFLIQA
ncbi:SAM-dependent methyltransferase [Arenibacter sp. GZD96]|uniref:SAM-dependent methyltransferase n=1 Tax=Aurantibrevibacter litoralis TaxID=3106030 RepID=UPI002AFE7CF1|nr:SAM-dependent methyltransferase [Arenibacter sp. GZD-96]MEA1786322.1 SAM-dependent methyltransferase [Arenibacter sp. GZD-96]